MNFLAHCTLADQIADQWQADDALRQGLLAGAVLGDFVKGPVDSHLPSALATGIRLHRRIDAISNRDPGITKLANLFVTDLRRFAPIFLDILADHALALDWPRHADIQLKEFSQRCYEAIRVERIHMSLTQPAERFLSYLEAENLLANYHQWAHVERASISVLRRLECLELKPLVLTELPRHVAPIRSDLNDIWTRLKSGAATLPHP